MPRRLNSFARRLGDHVANRALRVGADDIQRGGVHLGLGQLVAAQDEADLGPISMGDDQVPAALDHVGDVLAGLVDCIPLRGYILVFRIQNQ